MELRTLKRFFKSVNTEKESELTKFSEFINLIFKLGILLGVIWAGVYYGFIVKVFPDVWAEETIPLLVLVSFLVGICLSIFLLFVFSPGLLFRYKPISQSRIDKFFIGLVILIHSIISLAFFGIIIVYEKINDLKTIILLFVFYALSGFIFIIKSLNIRVALIIALSFISLFFLFLFICSEKKNYLKIPAMLLKIGSINATLILDSEYVEEIKNNTNCTIKKQELYGEILNSIGREYIIRCNLTYNSTTESHVVRIPKSKILLVVYRE